jgi:phosphotransferase system  glucose/maltose/N-acetylglucosamine-specific IIC component
MPGSWIFRYGALALTSLGILNLFADVFKTRATWLETKTVNLSRAGLILGMVSVNSLLEILNSAWLRPETTNFLYFFYDNFFYFFPAALALVVVSSWSIYYRVELIFTLNKRRH